MATSGRGDLEFRIGAELSELKKALGQALSDITGFGRKAREEVEKAATTAGRARDARGRFLPQGAEGELRRAKVGAQALGVSLGAAVSQVKALVGGFALLAGAIATIRAADELTQLTARLKIATSNTEEFTRAQTALFDIAQRTRTPLAETISLYTRIALATKDSKVGQDTLLEVVETINKAVQLSGSSAQAAEAALIQLGQGLASGTLRGEELNSVLEQTPALADAIAKGMGITRGELRKFGQEGKINAEAVIKALQAQREEVARSFSELPVTVGQAITKVRNASLQLLGIFDSATGATRGLSGALQDFAEFLTRDDVVGAVAELAASWGQGFADIANDFSQALGIIEKGTADLVGSDTGLISLIKRAIIELPANFRALVQIITVSVAFLVDVWVAAAAHIKDAFLAIFTDDTLDAAIGRFRTKVQAAAMAAQQSIEDILAERDRKTTDARQIGQGAVFARRAATNAANRSGTGDTDKKLTDEERRKAEALAKARADRDQKLAKDSTDRISEVLQDYYADNLISAQAYYDARERIELNAAEQSIAIERDKLEKLTDPAERTKILGEIEQLERSKADIQRRAQRDRDRAALAQSREIDQIRAQDLENQGRTAEAAKLRIEAQFADLIKRLEAAGDKVGLTLIRRVINAAGAKAEFDQIKADFDRTLADLQARQAAIADQQRTGAIGVATAQQQQSEARKQALADLDALNRKLQELAATANDPAIVEGAKRASEALRQLAIDSATGIDAAIQELRASLLQMQEDFAKMATGAGVDAVTGFFKDLAGGTKSASESLKDLARNFAASMADIAARALATMLVLQALDALFPGMGQAVAIGARVRHGGGAAGQGTLRYVNPLVFAGAPRLHSGTGGMGLKAGEIPAILQEGEQVTSKAEAAANQNAQAPGTRIINVIDPDLVEDYLTSAKGERTILNVIERNRGAVRQKLV